MDFTNLEFEVEYVLNRQPTIVFARQITPGDFHMTEQATLGGCPVSPNISMPRAHDSAGKQRFDLFAFVLLSGADRTKFTIGQRIELRP